MTWIPPLATLRDFTQAGISFIISEEVGEKISGWRESVLKRFVEYHGNKRFKSSQQLQQNNTLIQQMQKHPT